MKCLHRKSFLKRRLNLVPGSERSGPWEGCGKQPPCIGPTPPCYGIYISDESATSVKLTNSPQRISTAASHCSGSQWGRTKTHCPCRNAEQGIAKSRHSQRHWNRHESDRLSPGCGRWGWAWWTKALFARSQKGWFGLVWQVYEINLRAHTSHFREMVLTCSQVRHSAHAVPRERC